MKKIIIAVLTFSLVGCMSTPNEARKTDPLIDAHSNKSQSDMVNCISERWQETRFLMEYDNTVHSETRGDTTTVFTWKNSMFADVTKNKSGSRIKLYSAISGGMLPSNREQALSSCLK